MDDEAEGGGKGPVEFDFGLIFFSADPVQVRVNERLHGVDVHDVLHGFVVWVTEHLGSQGLVQVLVQVCQLEQLFPVASILLFQ